MVDNKSIVPMEIFRTDEFYVLMNSESSLWCNRRTGEIEAKPGWELANSGDPECLGVFYGLIGKVDFQGEGEARLLLVKETDPVGALPDGREVVKIRSIAFLHICGPEVTAAELGLRSCKKHKGGSLNVFEFPQKASLAKTWGSIKSATSSIKNSTQHAAAMATYQVKSGLKKDIKDKEKFEKRILDELSRIFTDTDSFYFCVGPPGSKQCDLTNCLQKQSPDASIDDRFFWNKYMLKDILEMNNDLSYAWVLPIIQGYVQIEHCNLEVDPLAFGSQRTESCKPGRNFKKNKTAIIDRHFVDSRNIIANMCQAQGQFFTSSPWANDRESNKFITIGIISRRSRYRAGTRYKRRGLDEDGKCANYVETEQFLTTANHHISFVMVRGSVPLFWSQPGYKYRPPPHIDKGEAETKLAFEKHMKEELELYGPVCIVNLVEQTGKEKVVWEGFTEQVISFDSPQVTYATFDFHEHCRGMKFENVSYLIARLEDSVQDMGFCWKDEQGVICRQNGVFRVNCIDCLDRTNVVQTALGKAILETQLTKLGLLSPEGVFPAPLRSTFQLLWANNGDIISKQYAGTNALKGDYTRTGERKFTGMMKDGMNSANRYLRRVLLDDLRQLSIEVCMGYELTPLTYSSTLAYEFLDVVSTQDHSCPSTYVERELLLGIAVYNFSRYYLSRFKDVYRQATIDIMQGQMVSEDMLYEHEDADSNATAEHVKLLIEDCKKLLISDSTLIVGAWGLINTDPVTGDPNETDMDTILILTRTSYYVADYDDEVDQVTKCQRVLLSDISMVELGPMELGQSQNPLQLFNKGKNKQSGHHCLRFRYKVDGNTGYSHTFRSSNLRFFNNVAIVIKTEEEMLESLRAICDCFRVALEVANEENVQWHVGAPLNKLTTPVTPNSLTAPNMPRNVSETQLVNLKNVGTKAISNMTSKFSKIGSSIRRKSSANQEMPLPEFAMEEGEVVMAPDYEDEDPRANKRDVSETKNDTFLPNVGIVMSNTAIQHEEDLDADDVILEGDITDGSRPSSLTVSKPTELKVRKFSHSSGEVDLDADHLKPDDANTSVSNKLELSLGSITSSQSENALKSLKSGFSNATNVLTSPSAVAVLSPLTKLAKGMQTLGANLDIRRLKQGKMNYEPTLETNRLKELWASSKCKSKLIAV